MQLCAVMAQIITILSLIVILFLAKIFIKTADSQSEEVNTPVNIIATYDEWYQSGMTSYTNGDWEDTIYYFERALEEFKFYRTSLVECRLKCRNLTRNPALLKDDTVVEEMKYFQGLFMKANCVRKCKFDKLGNRPQVINQEVTDKFLGRMPYSYLQFAYYKSFEYEKAVAASYTYLQWNPDDEVMQNNLDYYRNLHGITEDHLVDLEELLHHKYFLLGYSAYQNGEFLVVIENMEKALEYYWKADDECRALCEGKYENREFMDLYEAISNHYASVLFCKGQCEEWNSRMQGKSVENYLPNHFHFLQFAYYKEENLEKAVNAAASFLVLVPHDPTMNSNMQFYEEEEGANKYTIQPMKEVEEYQKRKDMEYKLLQFAKMRFWGEEDKEYLEETYIDSTKSMLYTDEAEPINPDEVRLRSNSRDPQSGQSWADVHDDNKEFMTKPEEVWTNFEEEYDDEDSEMTIMEHFPQNDFSKPEEIWPEDVDEFFDDEDDEELMREYSPEPGVIYKYETEDVGNEKDDDSNEDVKDEAHKLQDVSSDEMVADKQEDEGHESHGKDNSNQGDKEKSSNSEKEIYVDPDLGYRVDDHGIKWPNVKDDATKESQTDTETSSKPKDDKEVTKDGLTNRKKRRPMSKESNESTVHETDFISTRNDSQDVESISALNRLKVIAKAHDLLPSGPPHFGPSIHGRREIEDKEEEEVEVPSYVPSLDGVKLYMNAAMLNGTKRMAADNIATQLECNNLIKLMDIESKMGDGYNGKVYPHTKYESFEGMTVMVAVNAAKNGRVPLALPATYLHLAEKSRIFMKKYYNLKKELFFSYTHLVCRTAEPDSTPNRDDPSHPIHADNCQIDEKGVCHKTPPSFTWRDWSAVLYLNDDFIGGDFVFAHPNFTIQSVLRPKCGRLVGFSAGEENLHGVKGVISGRRCALALWFTEDPHYQEIEFNAATVAFTKTWEEQEALKKSKAAAKSEL